MDELKDRKTPVEVYYEERGGLGEEAGGEDGEIVVDARDRGTDSVYVDDLVNPNLRAFHGGVDEVDEYDEVLLFEVRGG